MADAAAVTNGAPTPVAKPDLSNPRRVTRSASVTAPVSVPLTGNGESAKRDVDVSKHTPVTEYTQTKRELRPLIERRPEDAPAPETPKPNPATEAAPDRHAKWKEEQSKKREAREAARQDRALKDQQTAKGLLQKGDLLGAAKALGMSVSELATLVGQGAMGIKDEPKPLTPEEQRAADEKKFREDRLAFEKEQREWRQHKDTTEYIARNLSPILADKDAFEFVHTAGVEKIERYAYDYMNEHYQATGETLNAKDVLETIEQQLYEAHVQSLEKAKTIKKVAKYFAPTPPEGESLASAAAAQQAEDDPAFARDRAARQQRALQEYLRAQAEEAATEEQEKLSDTMSEGFSNTTEEPEERPRRAAPRQPIVNLSARWPGRGLSAAERLAELRREDEDARRRR